MSPTERVNGEREETGQGVQQGSEEFPGDGEEKSQGDVCAAGSESSQNWEVEGFRRDVSERKKKGIGQIY